MNKRSDSHDFSICRCRGLRQFTPAERRLIRRLNTPIAVQRFLNRMPYNTEPSGDTLRGFRQVVRRGTAHCLEAALTAACIMEQHGYPPLLMGLEFDRRARPRHLRLSPPRPVGRGGAVARSRPARAQGGVPFAARARGKLFRSVHRLHRPRHRLLGHAHAGDGIVRLAIFTPQRLGGREHAAARAASQDQAIAQARAPGAAKNTAPIWRSTRRSRCITAAARSGRRFRSTFCSADLSTSCPATLRSTAPCLLSDARRGWP